MEADVRLLVQAIHDCYHKLVLVTAGAGTQSLSELLGVAGATRTLLEALVPYSEASFDEFLGQKPSQYVTAGTARLMAGRAFTRAMWLEKEEMPVIGIACTATIVTDRPKRGKHRAHIAIWQPHRLACFRLRLKKGARDRAGEENLVSRLLLAELARACGVPHKLSLPLLAGDKLESEISQFDTMARRLEWRDIEYFGIQADGHLVTAADAPPVGLLCGAFNPLHDGHLALVQAAADILQQPVAFEISAVNVDKPALAPDDVLGRMAQFAGRWPVFASAAPTFIEKARIYPGVTFVVGYDTAERILQPRYYKDSQDNMLAALDEIHQQRCRFLVAGRLQEDGTFRHLRDLDIPAPYESLFQAIPDDMFRKDISSTELRRTGRRGSR